MAFDYRNQGHFNAMQYAEKMMNGSGDLPTNNNVVIDDNDSLSENDVIVGDVLPQDKKKKKPLLTKKGKLVVALIVLGFFAYDLYTRHKAKQDVGSSEPKQPEQPKAEQGSDVSSGETQGEEVSSQEDINV